VRLPLASPKSRLGRYEPQPEEPGRQAPLGSIPPPFSLCGDAVPFGSIEGPFFGPEAGVPPGSIEPPFSPWGEAAPSGSMLRPFLNLQWAAQRQSCDAKSHGVAQDQVAAGMPAARCGGAAQACENAIKAPNIRAGRIRCRRTGFMLGSFRGVGPNAASMTAWASPLRGRCR
jgi:hypothetical protein